MQTIGGAETQIRADVIDREPNLVGLYRDFIKTASTRIIELASSGERVELIFPVSTAVPYIFDISRSLASKNNSRDIGHCVSWRWAYDLNEYSDIEVRDYQLSDPKADFSPTHTIFIDSILSETTLSNIQERMFFTASVQGSFPHIPNFGPGWESKNAGMKGIIQTMKSEIGKAASLMPTEMITLLEIGALEKLSRLPVSQREALDIFKTTLASYKDTLSQRALYPNVLGHPVYKLLIAMGLLELYTFNSSTNLKKNYDYEPHQQHIRYIFDQMNGWHREMFPELWM